MKRRSYLIFLAVFVFSAVIVACGDDAADTTSVVRATTTTAQDVSSTADTTTTAAATTSTAATTTTSSTTTTSAPTSTTTTTSAPSTTTTTTTTLPPPTGPLPENLLPGTNFDLAPVVGAVLSVVGVQYDDVLNVRQAPGTNYAVIDKLAPTAESIVATGRARMLTQSIWWEVTTDDGLYGWVGASFTARRGPTFDQTSFIVDQLGGIPQAATMEALGKVVADVLVAPDADFPSKVVLVVAPAVGDLGEVTYDIVGLGDDTTHALRAHVFGQPSDGGFSLMSAEVTDMCDSIRGPSEPGGLCA